MSPAPKIADYPRIRKALKFYMVTSVITGVMLLFLVVEMVLKYGFGYEVFAFAPQGAITLVPINAFGEAESDGFNLSTGILIAHGWFYVVYLFGNFLIWSPMRWPFWKFLLLASGGIVPLLSFFLEGRISREVNAELAAGEAAQAPLVEAAH